MLYKDAVEFKDFVSETLDKRCLDLYLELGTYKKVRDRLALEGYLSVFGNPYDISTIRTMAVRYLIFYPEQYKEKFQLQEGFSEDTWLRFLFDGAKRVFRNHSDNSKFIQWLRCVGFDEKEYYGFYKDRFPRQAYEG